MGNQQTTQKPKDFIKELKNWQYIRDHIDPRYGEIKIYQKEDSGETVCIISRIIHKPIKKNNQSSLAHQNLLKLYYFQVDEQKLAYEYLNNDLRSDIAIRNIKRIPYSEPQLWGLLYQAISVLNYLAENGVHHQDLNPSNILLDLNGNVKIQDMSLLGHQMTAYAQACGQITEDYHLAPEELNALRNKQQKPTNIDPEKVDVFQLALSVLHAAGLEDTTTLFDLFSLEINYDELERRIQDIQKYYSLEFAGFLRSMLSEDPHNRYNFQYLLQELPGMNQINLNIISLENSSLPPLKQKQNKPSVDSDNVWFSSSKQNVETPQYEYQQFDYVKQQPPALTSAMPDFKQQSMTKEVLFNKTQKLDSSYSQNKPVSKTSRLQQTPIAILNEEYPQRQRSYTPKKLGFQQFHIYNKPSEKENLVTSQLSKYSNDVNKMRNTSQDQIVQKAPQVASRFSEAKLDLNSQQFDQQKWQFGGDEESNQREIRYQEFKQSQQQKFNQTTPLIKQQQQLQIATSPQQAYTTTSGYQSPSMSMDQRRNDLDARINEVLMKSKEALSKFNHTVSFANYTSTSAQAQGGYKSFITCQKPPKPTEKGNYNQYDTTAGRSQFSQIAKFKQIQSADKEHHTQKYTAYFYDQNRVSSSQEKSQQGSNISDDYISKVLQQAQEEIQRSKQNTFISRV